MNGKRLVLATVAATAMALAGAAPGDDWRVDATAKAAGAAERAEPQQTKLKLTRSPYGKVLFANGYAIYKFTADKGSESQCYGECAEAWPPLDARGEIVAGKGVKERLIGTTVRNHGGEQVTYDGHPVYGYEYDPRGEVFCHDVTEFGGEWLAVKRNGAAAPH